MNSGGLIVLLILIVLFYRHTSTLYRYVVSERAVTLEKHIERLEPELIIKKPPSASGRIPVAVFMPGCLHLLSHNPAWDEFFLSEGYGVVIVDSFTPRKFDIEDEDDLDPICDGKSPRGFDRAADVYAIVEYLGGLEWVDSEKIMLAGWSHGAWAIMDAMAWHEKKSKPYNVRGAARGRLNGVNKIWLMYPHCGFGAAAYVGFDWSEGVPTLLVLAGKDKSVNPEHCRRWYRKQKDNDDLELLFLNQAEHTFDIPAPYNDKPNRYDREYFDEVKGEVGDLLTRESVKEERRESRRSSN